MIIIHENAVGKLKILMAMNFLLFLRGGLLTFIVRTERMAYVRIVEGGNPLFFVCVSSDDIRSYHEENISASQPQAQEHPRVSLAHGDEERTQCPGPSSCERSQKAYGQRRTIV